MVRFTVRFLVVFCLLLGWQLPASAATTDTLYIRTDTTVNVRMYFVIQDLLFRSGYVAKIKTVNNVAVLDSSDTSSFYELNAYNSALLSGRVNKIVVRQEGGEHHFAPVNPRGQTPFWFKLSGAKHVLPDSDFVYLRDYIVNRHTFVQQRIVRYVAQNSRFDNSFCHNPTGITTQIVNNLQSGTVGAYAFSFPDSPMRKVDAYPFDGYSGIFGRKLQYQEVRETIFWLDTSTAGYDPGRHGFRAYERTINDSFYAFVFKAEVFDNRIVTDLNALLALGPMRTTKDANGQQTIYNPYLVNYAQLRLSLSPLQLQIVEHTVYDDFTSDVVWRLSESVYWMYPDVDSAMVRIMNEMKQAARTQNLASYHDPEFRIRQSKSECDSLLSDSVDIVAISVVRYWYRTDSKAYTNMSYVLAVGPVVRDKSGNCGTLCYWRYDMTLLRAIGEDDYFSIGQFIERSTIYGEATLEVDGHSLTQPNVGVRLFPVNLFDSYGNGDTISVKYMILNGPGIKPGEAEIYITVIQKSRPVPKVTSQTLLPTFVGTFQPMPTYFSSGPPKMEEYYGTLAITCGFGYMDTSGVMIIQPQFQTASLFSESRARVSNFLYAKAPGNSDFKYGFIDSTGTLIGEYKYDDARDFHEGRAAVCIRFPRALKWGFVDLQINEVVQCRYLEVRDYQNGFAAVRDSTGWFFIDKNGSPLMSGRYVHIHDFEGTTAVVTEGKKYERKMGIIDAKGAVMVPLEYDTIGPLSDGLRMVKRDSLYGFMNEKGKMKLAMKYDGANSFLNGYASVSINHQWGYIDRKGKVVLAHKYDWAGFYSEGLFAVRQNHKWGYVDERGDTVINFQYDSVGVFRAGRFPFMQSYSRNWWIADATGSIQFSTNCYMSEPIIDRQGNVIAPAYLSIAFYDPNGQAHGQNYYWSGQNVNDSRRFFLVSSRNQYMVVDGSGRSYFLPN